MLTSRIIPCLDVRDGRVVKGVKFQGLQDSGDPVERAVLYEEQGADEIVILDVSATPEERSHQVETTRSVREELSIPLTVGGGVRSVEDARDLLEAGADKVAVNTAAVKDPGILSRMADEFGRQCTVTAIDAASTDDEDEWEVVVRSGTERPGLNAVEWAQTAAENGAGEILLTSWDRDGTREGYDLDLLRAVSASVSVPIIASGGADCPDHLVDALENGADAVLAASIFHFGDYTVRAVKEVLKQKGIQIRPAPDGVEER